jgi:hypothetical protein
MSYKLNSGLVHAFIEKILSFTSTASNELIASVGNVPKVSSGQNGACPRQFVESAIAPNSIDVFIVFIL